MSLLTKCVALAAILLCFAVSDTIAKQTVIDAIRCNGYFSTLKAAIKEAGLTEALTEPNADITLFAPTNDAFAAALEELDISAEELLASPKLADILKYHVLPGKRLSSSLQNGDELATLLDPAKLLVTTNGEDVLVNDATVIIDDRETDNGVVHVIDMVLLPPKNEIPDADEKLVKEAQLKDVPILG